MCCKHGAKVKPCKIEHCTKNAVKGGLCCKHGRMEGVMEERICRVENCTNMVLKKKTKGNGSNSNKASAAAHEEEEQEDGGGTVTEDEEEFCKRHAVKKVDEDGHVICSARWCRNKVIVSGGEGSSANANGGDTEEKEEEENGVVCCDKGNEAVPLCVKHCKTTHHLDCDSDCKSSIHHDHDHHHHDEEGEITKKSEGEEKHDHHHHHHDHNRKLAPCGKCSGCKTPPCKKCTNCTSTPKKRCEERACSNPIWMDRKEYDAMMERRRKKGGAAAAAAEGEKGGVEEEVVEELEGSHTHEHDHRHHIHEGGEKANCGAAAKEAVAVPKKPLNAYMRYVAEIREVATAEFPDLTGKELVSLLYSFCFCFVVFQVFSILSPPPPMPFFPAGCQIWGDVEGIGRGKEEKVH